MHTLHHGKPGWSTWEDIYSSKPHLQPQAQESQSTSLISFSFSLNSFLRPAMGYKAAITLGLLPKLLSASVVCSFSMAASEGDTCESFATSWGQTVEMFQELNPGVSCPTLTAGQSYCIIGTVTDDPVTTSTATSTTLKTTTTATTTTSSNQHEPTQPGLPSNCDKFHLVASGDQCDIIAAEYGISEAQFKDWNPSIDSSMPSPLYIFFFLRVCHPVLIRFY
ncbi:hypothetical protein BDV37DRAFT_247391 [Aspergillus pseudonomiae]|uniref:LysM domain-containing protein n=1 Tax=Aspergillus pseudonomiae TaxID=1506151 RepID=A0A5N7DFK2_9EURO|nr:uncharacterized protein BDV37DRAFT_247391 [Aspergillus pseudonomiae]KAE8404438.1 hypothetical protein BDV37DRAFT_247391 [Aspergillus pseudonomiae]